MTDEPRYPRVHVTQIVERGGRKIHEVLSSPVCDFCGHDSPAWDYDCHDFIVIEDTDLSSMGGFAACTPCSDMIEAGDWDDVLDRCVEAARRFAGNVLAERIRVSAALVHRYFRENRYGERRPWG